MRTISAASAATRCGEKRQKETFSIGGPGDKWLDVGPKDGTFYCRASRRKPNVPIRNMAQTVKRHARSVAHKKAVSKCTGADASGGGTPPAEHFLNVWVATCKGRWAGNCLPKTGKRERTDKLI